MVVGDNLGRLVEALRSAVGRADAVVITGGIGPTRDDLTREALCELAGVETPSRNGGSIPIVALECRECFAPLSSPSPEFVNVDPS